MRLFIGDRPIKITDRFQKTDSNTFDFIVDADKIGSVRKLKGKLLIKGTDSENIHDILDTLEKNVRYASVILLTANLRKTEAAVKKHYKIVEAGGGLVIKDGKFLLMRRLGKWDLPKGKLDKGEGPSEGALRETEEECGVRAVVEEKLCTTCHTYSSGGRRMLKKTYWFLMSCTDDREMKPQEEEFIEELRWVSSDELNQYLENSYNSIRTVFKKYFKKNSSIGVKRKMLKKLPKVKS